MRYLITFLLLITASFVHATTWGEGTAVDPISGKEIKVPEIASYGSYIYEWPSKYDGVFWPLTDEQYLRFSPDTGYIAFSRHFESITEEEKEKVRTFLKNNYSRERELETFQERLDWLEEVSRARGMGDDFWLDYYCLRAHLSRLEEDVSTEYRKKAVPVAERRLQKLEAGQEKARVLYILTNYSRLLGKEDEAKQYFEQLKNLSWKATEEEGAASEEIVAYYTELANAVADGSYREEYLGR